MRRSGPPVAGRSAPAAACQGFASVEFTEYSVGLRRHGFAAVAAAHPGVYTQPRHRRTAVCGFARRQYELRSDSPAVRAGQFAASRPIGAVRADQFAASRPIGGGRKSRSDRGAIGIRQFATDRAARGDGKRRYRNERQFPLPLDSAHQRAKPGQFRHNRADRRARQSGAVGIRRSAAGRPVRGDGWRHYRNERQCPLPLDGARQHVKPGEFGRGCANRRQRQYGRRRQPSRRRAGPDLVRECKCAGCGGRCCEFPAGRFGIRHGTARSDKFSHVRCAGRRSSAGFAPLDE